MQEPTLKRTATRKGRWLGEQGRNPRRVQELPRVRGVPPLLRNGDFAAVGVVGRGVDAHERDPEVPDAVEQAVELRLVEAAGKSALALERLDLDVVEDGREVLSDP